MINNNTDHNDLKDERAKRRDGKKKPKMKQHGRALKKPTDRGALHQLKAQKSKKK